MRSPDSRPAITLPMPIPAASAVHESLRVLVVGMQRFFGEQQHRVLKQRAEVPEPGDPADGQPHRAGLPASVASADPDFMERIPTERDVRTRGRSFGDSQARHRAGDGNRKQREAHVERGIFPAVKQEDAEAAAQHDGREGGELDQSIGARQLLFPHNFGQNPVLRRTEEVGLRGQAEQDHQQHIDAVRDQRENPEHHHGDLEQLGDLQDARLAEAVCDLAGGAGEKQERQDKDRVGHRQILAASSVLIDRDLDRSDRYNHLVDVVVERGQKLGPKKGLETAIAKKF